MAYQQSIDSLYSTLKAVMRALLLSQKVAVGFVSNGSHCQLIITLLCLFDGLSTVSIHYLYSTLRVMMRPLDTIHKKTAFKDNKNSPIKLFIDYTITLISFVISGYCPIL